MTVSPTDDKDPNSTANAALADGATAESPTANEGAKKADSPPAALKDGIAESSTASKRKGGKSSMVDRIQAATDKLATEKSPSSDKEDEGDDPKPEAAPEGDAEGAEKPFTDAELAALSAKTRKRMEYLSDAAKQAEQYKPAAEQYNQIVGFLRDNQLSMDDANLAFDLLRARKHNPQAALNAFREIVSEIEHEIGAVLPEDLNDQVQKGFITESAAKELSERRAAEKRAKDQQIQFQEHQKRESAASFAKSMKMIAGSLSAWEQKWAATDPDYSKKRDEVKEQMELALGRIPPDKIPQTTEAAIKLAEECKRKVESKFAKFAPKMEPITHVAGSSAVSTPAKPKSMKDAILQAANA